MRKSTWGGVLVLLLPVFLVACAGGGAEPAPGRSYEGRSTERGAAPSSASCQGMHQRLEKLYRSGKGQGREYSVLLDRYMGRCL